MRSLLLLISLSAAAAAVAMALATPADRAAFWSWLLGPPPPAPTQPGPTPSGIDLKQVVTAAPALPRRPPAAPPAERVETHDDGDNMVDACGGPPTLAVTEVQASKVYQFTDASGVRSFSDKKPVTTRAQDLSGRYRKREQYFRVRLIHDQAPGAVRMQSRIMADTQQIFLFLAQHLEVDNLRQVFLDLRLYPDRASFAAYRRQVAPKLNTNSGFYSSARNEAVVRMRRDDELTLEVVRHETSHLIAAALFGNLPKWLNEGLAEYFERMQIDGLSKTISPSPYFLKVLRKHRRQGTLPALQGHLKLSSRQWLRQDEALRYAVGWSLVYYLMAQSGGRQFLASLLDAQAQHRCRRFSTSRFVDQGYPGGIAALDREWRRWLSGKDPVAHYF